MKMKEKEIIEKEINLLDLITIFFNWLKKIINSTFKFLGSLFQLIYRHSLITIIITVVCILISLYITRPEARVYKADALALLYGCDAQTVREISKQLEYIGEEEGYSTLSSKLSLPDSITKNIVGFHTYFVISYLKDGIAVKVDYKDIYPLKDLKDTLYVKMRDRVSMRLLVKNTKQIPQIQKAILDYFNNNELLKIRLESFKDQMNQQIYISGIELKRVDSLARVTYFKDNQQQIRLEQNKLLFGEQQKQLFYGDLLKLQDIISSSKSALANTKNPIALVSGFAVDPKPVNGIMKYGVYSIFIGIFISLIIAALMENLTVIIKYLRTKP